MQAIEYDRYGPPEVLTLRRVPLPSPGPGEVLVRVRASGLNPKDAVLRAGDFRLFSGLTARSFPKRTGFDLAGEVAQVGPDVTDLRTGDRVWGLLDGFRGGAAAEYVAAPAAWLAPLPAGLGFEEGAAWPLVGLTALQALRDRARLRAGERLLVIGASGGVGSAAIQIARAWGARVTAVASAANLVHCRELGADETVDYATTDPARLPGPYDVILDARGVRPPFAYRHLLPPSGRFVAVAPHPAALIAAPLSRLGRGPRVETAFVRSSRADLDALAGLVRTHGLRMPIEARHVLGEAREAHAALAARHARGKRVLVVAP